MDEEVVLMTTKGEAIAVAIAQVRVECNYNFPRLAIAAVHLECTPFSKTRDLQLYKSQLLSGLDATSWLADDDEHHGNL